MESSEYLKLLMPNGTHTLLDKSEYLELARQKGWDTKIPQLEGGTYDCDVFGGDGVKFNFKFSISGALFLKDHAVLYGNIWARDGIILGNKASTFALSSDNGDVIIGNNADTCAITGKNVICGDELCANYWDISATDGFVILGKDLYVDDHDDCYEISATEDIICDDEPVVEDSQNS